LASCFWPGGVWRTVRLDVADRPRGTSFSRIVCGRGSDHLCVGVRVGAFCCN
jgi:hypothetical protein